MKHNPDHIIVWRVVISSGRLCPTRQYRNEPGVFYYVGSHRRVSGPFKTNDQRFRKAGFTNGSERWERRNWHKPQTS